MSEDQSRSSATRGRSAGRGGRGGGHSNRAATRSNKAPAINGDSKHEVDSSLPTLDDGGDVRELKQKYGSKIGLIKEMFSDWSDIDILYALQEADGDESLAVTRIADGAISQWGEVSKQKKDRARTKAKQDTFTTTADSGAKPSRGGRNAVDGGRGRGRAPARGAPSTARGKSAHATTNGTRSKENQPLSVPTEESSAWDAPKPVDASTARADVASDPASGPTKATVIPEGSQKTWASMLRQSTVPKPAPKSKEPAPPNHSEPSIEPLPPAEPPSAEPNTASDAVAELPAHDEAAPATSNPEISLPPAPDRLTETNLEHIIDTSRPLDSETSRSEAADSWSPHASAVSSAVTPIPPSTHHHHHQQSRNTSGTGYAVTAIKATERGAVRPPGLQRRILDQEEAVRMPGNRDQVDRATVQFGAFNLNGPVDEDIDGDREEPETRAQPPGDSPIAHPRTSLPPAQPAPVPDAFPPQKPIATHGAPPTGPAAAQPTIPPSQPSAAQAHPPTQPAAHQFGRFGQTVPQEPSSFSAQKPFDSFGPQPTTAATSLNQFEGAGFPSQPAQTQPPPPTQSQQAAFSSAPGDYSSYYTTDHQHRTPYSYYGQQFGHQQQAAHGQQEPLASQQQHPQPQPQRSFSGYNAPQPDNLSQYPQSGVHAQGRYGTASSVDVQNSGNTTPNPPVTQAQAQAQQPGAQAGQTQSHGQQQPHDYPYSHPYFTSPYYAAYMNQYQGNYSQAGYRGLYQPHQYGMSPQGPYGHASSPASGFNQSSLHRADSGVGAGAGLSDYGRAGSAQSANQPALGGTGFGGAINDTFGRGASAYQSQAAAGQPFSGPASQQGNPPSAGDDLKPFGEPKAGAGPSPSLASAARPGSAANNAASQAGLPPPQSGQQAGLGMSGYGGYPSHLQGHGLHGTQSGASGYGMGAGAQGHSNTPYGGYGQAFGGSYYAANQPRGWGGNYH